MAFCSTCALVWATVALAAYFLYKKFFNCPCSGPKLRNTEWKEDTVYLYQFPRPPKMANLSPFCVKLEMFMRINNIKYVICFITSARSKYGLVPFIELNGVHYADSQLIVEKLKEHFKIKIPERKRSLVVSIASRIVILSRKNSYLGIFIYIPFGILIKYKVLDHFAESVELVLTVAGAPKFLIPVILPLVQFFFKGKVNNRIHTMLGPFSDQEFHMLLKKDLDAIRDALGKRKFLMGDDPTAVDCTVFGQLATVFYLEMDTELKRIVRAEYPTIQEYLDRVIAKVFPSEFA